MANPVDGVCSGIHLNIYACSFHDHTNDNEQQHDEESLASAPNIDDLSNSQIAYTSQNCGDDTGSSQQSMLRKGRSDIGYQITLHGLEESIDEGYEVEPTIAVSEMLILFTHLVDSWPGSREALLLTAQT